jgi:predicted O-methyltransferase YrrM
MKKLLNSPFFRRTTDVLLSPVTLFSAIWFKFIRSARASQMPLSEKIFMTVGVLPVRDQYYQPLINPARYLKKPLTEPRSLPGIAWNTSGQLALLEEFRYQDELRNLPLQKGNGSKPSFFYNNPSICAADAEFLYNIVRHYKPRRFIEIGCGYTTLLSLLAEEQNKKENGASCTHTCIEPYEAPWLEELNVQVVRKKVEDLSLVTLTALEAGDILFIDSSHIIRPQGDVLFEFLEILPSLRPGVLVHVHDVFSPRDYPQDWVMDTHSFWNEQYLLEAFLSFNDRFTIIGAVNFLKCDHAAALEKKCPITAQRPRERPGSFWIVRN